MNQTIFIPRYKYATLLKSITSNGGGLQFVEGSRLLRDFHVGGIAKIGETRWWRTSNIMSITEVETLEGGLVRIFFKTRNSLYAIEVKANDITYRSDLGPLIEATQNGDIESDEWLTTVKSFTGVVNEEYNSSQEIKSIGTPAVRSLPDIET